MLCPKCGYYAEKDDSVCPECGEILNDEAGLPTEGAEAIRQGKKARMAILDAAAKQTAETRRRRRSGASHATVEMPVIHDEREEEAFPVYPVSEADISEEESEGEQVFERRRRQVYDENAGLEEQERAYAEWIGKGGKRRFGMVNWMKVSMVIVTVLILLLAGTWLFLNNTDTGQRVLARMGKTTNSSALWSLGEEQMNSGDLEGAIQSFEKAKAQDEKEKYVDVDGLLMLCSVYEAVGQTDAAVALYEKVYQDTPARPEAYINLIRILRNSGKPGDLARAGELMKKAFASTNEESFQTQRKDLIPSVPEAKPDAGFHQNKIMLTLTSKEGYDVYYTFDDKAELPYGGILYTEPIPLTEKQEGSATWNLRTVAVNGELVSEVLTAKYKIVMPSPQTPLCNLAPGAYKSRQKVKLRPGKENEKDDDITIYYTVDGSIPNDDSPIYKTGEQIQLPSGHSVTIKAIAVNQYKKQSNMMEYNYKIEAKPYPLTAWTIEETIAGLELNKTTMNEFQSTYGEGTRVEMEQPKGFETECRKYEYPWGYTVMNLSGRNWLLVELYFTDDTFKAPRGTGIGDPMNFVVSKFRDMGQLESEKGNRGLYQLDNTSDGKIYYDKEKKTWRILYRIPKSEHWYRLEYFTDENGIIVAVDWQYYIPHD